MSNPYAPPSRDPSGAEDRSGAPPHGPGHGTGDRRPPAPPPDPEDVARASRLIQHFGAFGLAALVTFALPIPWNIASAVFALTATVVGVRALLAARRAQVGGGRVVAVGAGVGVAAVVVLMFVSAAPLLPLQLEYQDCRRAALTVSARATCDAAFQAELRERIRSFGGGSTDP